MGSRAATTRRPPRRSRGDRPVGVDRWSRGVIQASRRNSANSRSGTSPKRTLWPSCSTDFKTVRRGDDGRRAGHHDDGGQTVPGFVETPHRERAGVDPVLRSLVERGTSRCFPDGFGDRRCNAKGLRGGRAPKAFRHRALVQRSCNGTRENVVSYLAKRERVWRQRLQRASGTDSASTTRSRRPPVCSSMKLEERNQSAAGSLAEGLDETLTLHRASRVWRARGRAERRTPARDPCVATCSLGRAAAVSDHMAELKAAISPSARWTSSRGKVMRLPAPEGEFPGFVTHWKRELNRSARTLTRRETKAA